MDQEAEQERRIQKLEEMFELLDQDCSGAIDIEEMRLLGKITSGSNCLPSTEEAKEQLLMADKNSDNQIDLGEWLEFSEPLYNIPKEKFDSLMKICIENVRTTLQPDGCRFVDKSKPKVESLPMPLFKSLSNGKLDTSDKLIEDNQARCSSMKETFSDKKGMNLSIDIPVATLVEKQKVLDSPAGWFWGTCCMCDKPSKINCERCKMSFCALDGASHFQTHAQKVAVGEETADSPEKSCMFWGSGEVQNADSKYGISSENENKELDQNNEHLLRGTITIHQETNAHQSGHITKKSYNSNILNSDMMVGTVVGKARRSSCNCRIF